MSATEPQPTPLRLLIVDDHVDSTRALSRLLCHEGYTVITAHTVTGALALVAGQQPVDVLLSDIGLPDRDGCELLRRLRAYYGERPLAALALSGLGDDDAGERCRDAGFQAFLMKPVAFEQVSEAIRALRLPGRNAPAAPRATNTAVSLGGVPTPATGG